MKVIESKFGLYQMSAAGIALGSLSILFVAFEHAFMRGVIMVVSSIGLSWYPILVSACILEFFSKDANFYLQIAHGIFGVGALLGPYVVFWFQSQTYTILALINVLFVFFYCSGSSPEEKVKKEPLLEES